MCVYTSIDCGNFISQHSGDCLAYVEGVRKGRGRELGRETPSPFNACHAGWGLPYFLGHYLYT